MSDQIKAELSAHCMKLMERMDACHEIEKAELTEHAEKERKEFLHSVLGELHENCLLNVQSVKEEWTNARDKINDFITEKVNEEIARLEAVGKDVEETIAEHADKEIDKIQKAFEYIESNLEADAINNEDWNENPKFHCLLGSIFTESDIVDLVKFCLTRLQK